MSNRLADARQALVDALAPILPGRVDPYAPPPGVAFVAPYIWIGQPAGVRTTIGERTVVMVATFPVTVIYDGSVKAQLAGLDDVVSQVVDAVAAVPRAEVARWRPIPPEAGQPANGRATVIDVDQPANRRATVIDVDVTITAATLCLPTPGQAVIPPVPVEV